MEDRIKQFLKTIKLNESMLSMFFGVVTVILVGILIFRVYNANKPEITQEAGSTETTTEKVGDVPVEVKEDGKKYPATLPDFYTVQAGDHLWKIAESQYGSGYNWVDIAKENKLSDAGHLAVGQELTLPKVSVIEVKATESKPATTMTAAPASSTIAGDTYTVVKGDTLWTISVRAYTDGYRWGEIARANTLSNPNHIEVGQVVKLPR